MRCDAWAGCSGLFAVALQTVSTAHLLARLTVPAQTIRCVPTAGTQHAVACTCGLLTEIINVQVKASEPFSKMQQFLALLQAMAPKLAATPAVRTAEASPMAR
jgi:hypothetical protein